MRHVDPFNNCKVVRATRILDQVCRQLRLTLSSVRLDSSEIFPVSDELESLLKSAFGALRGVSTRDLRMADGGAAAELKRVEAQLLELRRRFLAELPPEPRILSDLIKEKQHQEELLSEVVSLDPAYYNSAPHVMLGKGSSILGVLAVIYLCITNRAAK